jgi:acid phosphatase (class A)
MKRLIAGISTSLVLTAGVALAGPDESCPPSSCSSQEAPSGRRLAVPAEHYARLAGLDPAPRPGSGPLDRRLFDLAAMSPSYFKVLGREPVYLDVPPAEFSLPEFPANSSSQTRAELDFLLELQSRHRSPEHVARSKALAGVFYRVSTKPGDEDYERMRRNLFFVGRDLGEWFAPETLPTTADLMARVQSDATYYIWAFKYRYDRLRPYDLDARIERLETPNFPAYPSAHSGNSWVAAYVFSELLPAERDVFERGAAEMAFSREILGVHFPSDSASGRSLARQIVDRLMAVPAFQKDLAAARAEITAARRDGRKAASSSTSAKKDECF